ncbi:methyltransferase family protein [Methylocaldum sp. MU1018]
MNADSPIQRSLLLSGRFFFRVRNALFPVIFLLFLLLVRPAAFLGHAKLDAWVTAAGILMAFAGQAFRMLVIGYAYVKRGGKNREVFANELVTRGFYAHTRNPMYVGNFLIIAGLSLLYGSPWVYAVAIPFFAWVYLAIVTAEEAYLRDKFGAVYEAYAAKVNRFWPDLCGIRGSLTEFRYDWRRALVKEYNTLVFTLASLLALLDWKIAYVYGFEAHRTAIRLLCAGFIPLTLFYVSVRFLKKTRRLQPERKAESEAVFRSAK